MARIELDDETYALVIALADGADVTPDHIVKRALRALAEDSGLRKDDVSAPDGTDTPE